MLVEVRTQAEFDSYLASNERVAVFFMTTWCGPSKNVFPKVVSAEESFPSVKFIQVDIEQNQGISVCQTLRGTPVMKFYKSGEEYDRQLAGSGEIQNHLRSRLEELCMLDE